MKCAMGSPLLDIHGRFSVSLTFCLRALGCACPDWYRVSPSPTHMNTSSLEHRAISPGNLQPRCVASVNYILETRVPRDLPIVCARLYPLHLLEFLVCLRRKCILSSTFFGGLIAAPLERAYAVGPTVEPMHDYRMHVHRSVGAKLKAVHNPR